MATSVSNPTTASSLQLFSVPARALRPECAGGLRVDRALVFPAAARPAARRARWQPRPGPATGGRPVLRCGAVGTVGQQEFASEVLGSDLPVLVEFVAGWCGPCRLITPVIDWASQEYEGKLKVVKIDHDANPELIEKYKVYGLPTIILFKEGQEVPGSRREGAITKVKLKEYLNSVLESTTTVG